MCAQVRIIRLGVDFALHPRLGLRSRAHDYTIDGLKAD